MYCFGPIPSRRLGRSLGINNIPTKTCTYNCAYCQQGFSTRIQTERQAFYQPEAIIAQAQEAVERARSVGEPIDYLSIVPEGEATLDINLGQLIRGLKELGPPVALICNASLLWREDVAQDVAPVDWLSLKLDTVDEEIWNRLDHPARSLKLETILSGIVGFAKAFKGELHTETMLVKGINDNAPAVSAVATFIDQIQPHTACLLCPTRPPADQNATAPAPEILAQCRQLFLQQFDRVQCYFLDGNTDYASTGDPIQDILAIAAVHPMPREAVLLLLERRGQDIKLLDQLVATGQLKELIYQEQRHYLSTSN